MSQPISKMENILVFRRHGIFRLKTSHIYQDTTTNGFLNPFDRDMVLIIPIILKTPY